LQITLKNEIFFVKIQVQLMKSPRLKFLSAIFISDFLIFVIFQHFMAFSALTLLVGWQGRASACKTEWWGAGMVISVEPGADLHTAQLMPLPLTVSCFSKIQIAADCFYLSGTGSPG